jgi:multicomponent K+:H+ antiporter subunit E
MMARVLPYPVLAASLLVMWLLLNGFSAAQFVLGAVIALAASRIMAALEPAKPRLRRWHLIPKLFLIVLLDLTRSNIAVARIVLRGGRRPQGAGFVMIPLQLRDRTGLAVLACIITSTPGTVWVEYHSASNRLLIHVLDLAEEEHVVDMIKHRYEALLLEIFE